VARQRNQEVADLDDAIARLGLDESQRLALQKRYISYVDWLERAATRSRRGHYVMRLIAGIGGVVVTSMSSARSSAILPPA
jgi:hypothetical protein